MSIVDEQKLEMTRFCMDNAAEVIFILDSSGRFLYANKASLSLLGYSSEELLEMTIFQIAPECDPAEWQVYRDGLAGNGGMAVETIYRTKTGKTIPVEVKGSSPCLGENEWHCVFVRDISARKAGREKLQSSEQHLRKMLDATSDGVWDRNLVTGEVFYGANWAASLGYALEDVQNGSVCWQELLHPDDKDRVMTALNEYLQGRAEKYDIEFRLRNSYGIWQWMHARGKIVDYTPEGKPLRFVGTHTDITGRKMLELNNQKNSEEIKLFAYSVAHDLKNPSVVIKNMAERFRAKLDTLSEEEKHLYCDHIADSAIQLAELVEDINLFISAKESILRIENVPLQDLVIACRDEFAAQMQYRGVAWRQFEENPVVRLDRHALRRVFRNLIENSLKYGGEGLTEITLGYRNTLGFHILSVSDDGAGLSVDDSMTLFQPFERQNTSAETPGTGLGLAIVKEISLKHRGEVWVEARRGRGVTFCFAISKNL